MLVLGFFRNVIPGNNNLNQNIAISLLDYYYLSIVDIKLYRDLIRITGRLAPFLSV